MPHRFRIIKATKQTQGKIRDFPVELQVPYILVVARVFKTRTYILVVTKHTNYHVSYTAKDTSTNIHG